MSSDRKKTTCQPIKWVFIKNTVCVCLCANWDRTEESHILQICLIHMTSQLHSSRHQRGFNSWFTFRSRRRDTLSFRSSPTGQITTNRREELMNIFSFSSFRHKITLLKLKETMRSQKLLHQLTCQTCWSVERFKMFLCPEEPEPASGLPGQRASLPWYSRINPLWCSVSHSRLSIRRSWLAKNLRGFGLES